VSCNHRSAFPVRSQFRHEPKDLWLFLKDVYLVPGEFRKERSQWGTGGRTDPWCWARDRSQGTLFSNPLAQDATIIRKETGIDPIPGIDLPSVQPGDPLTTGIPYLPLALVEQRDPVTGRRIDILHRDVDLPS
jgi:hypothetical protein